MLQKPTILYVITEEMWGGAQRYVFDLVTHLSDDYHCVVAIGRSKGNSDMSKALTENNIDLIHLNYLTRSISPLSDCWAVKELQTLYNTLKPDIVHLNSSKASVIGSLAARLCKTKPKIVYTVHGWVFNEHLLPPLRSLYKILESWSGHYKDAFILLSPADNKQADQVLHIPQKKRHSIPLDIISGPHIHHDILCHELKKNYYIPSSFFEHPFRCITIANFFPTKDLATLLLGFKKIHDAGYDFRAIIMGDGPERANLEHHIKNLNLENQIILPGFVKDAARYLPLFNLFILSSRKEGLPYTILEAMSAKIPVIATAVGGIPHLIEHGETGWLIPPHNPTKLAEAIKVVIDDPNHGKNQAMKAYENSQRYSLEEMIITTKNLYNSLITSSKSPRSHQ